jgi:hypothetical protein
MTALAQLRCPGCGAAVPLVPKARAACPFCGAAVDTPPAWLEAAEARAAEARARRAIEPRWRELTRPPPAWVRPAAMALVAVLPPAVTVALVYALTPPPGTAAAFALGALPGLLPGALAWLWAAAVGATVVDVTLGLAAAPPARAGAPPSCRECGAPLAVEEGALAATCAYCGTDSLVADLPTTAESRARRRAAERTLAEAADALARRRRLLALGGLGLLVGVGGLSAALGVALAFAV